MPNSIAKLLAAVAVSVLMIVLSSSVSSTEIVERLPLTTAEFDCIQDCTSLVLRGEVEDLNWPTTIATGDFDQYPKRFFGTFDPVPVWVNEQGDGYTLIPQTDSVTSRSALWWILSAGNVIAGGLVGLFAVDAYFERKRNKSWV